MTRILTKTNVKLLLFLELAPIGPHNWVGVYYIVLSCMYEVMIHSFTINPSGNVLKLPQAGKTSTAPSPPHPVVNMLIFVQAYRTGMLKENVCLYVKYKTTVAGLLSLAYS